MFPVRILLRPVDRMPEALGYFFFDEEEFRGIIWIRANQTMDGMLDTLCEEWAHARTFNLNDHGSPDPHHHPSFWAEFGRIQVACRSTEW